MLGGSNSEAATSTRIKYVAAEPKPGTIEVELSTRVITSIRALDEVVAWELGDGQHFRFAPSTTDLDVSQYNLKLRIQGLLRLRFSAVANGIRLNCQWRAR